MQLGVVCRDHAGQEVIRDLRRWRASDDWAARRLIDEVFPVVYDPGFEESARA